jgi:FixJ family two-component response regulator
MTMAFFKKQLTDTRTTLRARRRAANDQILARLNAGESEKRVAEDFGLSVSAVKTIRQAAK